MRSRIVWGAALSALLLGGCVVNARTGSGGASDPSTAQGTNTPAPATASPSPTPAPTPVSGPTPTPGPAGTQRLPSRTVNVNHPAGTSGRSIPVPVVNNTNPFGDGDEHRALKGLIFFLPENTQSLPDLGAMHPEGILYTDAIQVPLRDFTEGFPQVKNRVEWFAIRYEGNFNVDAAGDWGFILESDDGSKLWIDGKLVVDNDGIHIPRPRTGNIALTQGSHTLRLDYFQGPKWAVCLTLNVRPPGGGFKPWGPKI